MTATALRTRTGARTRRVATRFGLMANGTRSRRRPISSGSLSRASDGRLCGARQLPSRSYAFCRGAVHDHRAQFDGWCWFAWFDPRHVAYEGRIMKHISQGGLAIVEALEGGVRPGGDGKFK